VVGQPVAQEVRRVPMLGVFLVDVAGVIEAAVAPIVAADVVGLVLPLEVGAPAAVDLPQIVVGCAGARLVAQREDARRGGGHHGHGGGDEAELLHGFTSCLAGMGAAVSGCLARNVASF